jgi:hypothetical protein
MTNYLNNAEIMKYFDLGKKLQFLLKNYFQKFYEFLFPSNTKTFSTPYYLSPICHTLVFHFL